MLSTNSQSQAYICLMQGPVIWWTHFHMPVYEIILSCIDLDPPTRTWISSFAALYVPNDALVHLGFVALQSTLLGIA